MPELDAHERRSGLDDLDRRLEGMCDERRRGAQTVEDLDGPFGDVPALVRARVRGNLVDEHCRNEVSKDRMRQPRPIALIETIYVGVGRTDHTPTLPSRLVMRRLTGVIQALGAWTDARVVVALTRPMIP
jgi:hypothetical protein